MLARIIDLRHGERRAAAQAFALLLLMIAAHTVLETARDALFLAKLPPRTLNVVYVLVAGLTLLVGTASAWLGLRIGARRALVVTLLAAALGSAVLFAMTATGASVISLYVFSGLVGAVLVPQFWSLVGGMFTAAQGRRLFGPVAAAGVIGGVVGSGGAALVLIALPVKALLAVASGAFVVAGAIAALAPARDDVSRAPDASSRKRERTTSRLGALRQEPFLVRIALLVALSTAALLTVDYLFKTTVARLVPVQDLGTFFARYYTALNVLSLVVQLFVGGAVVRRLGVASAAAVTPFLLLLGGVGSFLLGGAMIAVMITKAVDGGLRHSIHRITTELVYLPVPAAPRALAKPLIDGAISRIAQALAATMLLALAEAHVTSPRVLAAVVVVLSLAWLAVAATLRAPYLALFRRAFSPDALEASGSDADLDLDLTSAEALVEHLASRDPNQVVAVMNVLARRRRGGLIPALVLYHDDERVLAGALDIFAASARTDWIPLAERLLSHSKASVRIAAIRALATHGRIDLVAPLADDASSLAQGYAALHVALLHEDRELTEDPRIAAILAAEGGLGAEGRRGLLTAIADLPASPRASDLLLAFARDARLRGSAEDIALLSRAVAKLKDERFIEPLTALLEVRAGRAAVRAALVEIGPPAFDALAAALKDESRPRALRIHLPRTLSRFATQAAGERLLECIEIEKDGLVRYKALRGLGRVVAEHGARVDRKRIERVIEKNLIEHLRISALLVAFESKPVSTGDGMDAERAARAETSARLLRGLLADKVGQALQRAFRLLKIAHPSEDIHRANEALFSPDARARSDAGEFLDALLSGGDQRRVRELVRLISDDFAPHERIVRARPYLPHPTPVSHGDAVALMLGDADTTLARIAAHHAASLTDPALREAAEIHG
jgi:AAA family ATP:ADP antiporter